MPHRASAAVDAVGPEAVRAHPVRYGAGAAVGGPALQQALVHRHDVVAAGTEKAADRAVRPVAEGKYGLVAVSQDAACAYYALELYIQPAYTAQGVVDLLPLELELALVAHVHQRAAAAFAVGGAGGLHAPGGGGKALLAPSIAHGPAGLDYFYAPALAGYGAAHKDGPGSNPADAQPFGGEPGYVRFEYFVFLKSIHISILTRAPGICKHLRTRAARF